MLTKEKIMPTETLTPSYAIAPAIPIVRISPDNATVLTNLGLLQELAGSWHGHGFNLIARPDAQNQQNLYLQLNQTQESLHIDPIGSSIPNRGFGQNDIELFGLTYLQKINDIFTGGALHIEPGIWITQPATTYPPESAATGAQIIGRMGSIPHGNSLLAQGTAEPFSGAPTLKIPSAPYAFSQFPSFNSTPFPTFPTAPPVINAAGTSEKLNAAASVPPVPPFEEYDVTVPESATNPRTPFATNPPDPPLPPNINGVSMQTVINDPISLLQQVINQQLAHGYTFEGTVLNISTQAKLTFRKNPNDPTGPTTVVSPQNGAGGIENILFLEGGGATRVKRTKCRHCDGLRNFLDRESEAQRPSALHSASIRTDGRFELPHIHGTESTSSNPARFRKFGLAAHLCGNLDEVF